MILHSEVLNQDQRILLPILGSFANANGFYLGGGTSIALQLGHRMSIDFDWFTQESFGDSLLLAERIRQSGLEILNAQIAPGTLHGIINSVRVSFFEYRYRPLCTPSVYSDLNVTLASLDDLACMKIAAIAQRGSRKDFIDLYFLTLRYKSVTDFLNLYQHKYMTKDISHVLLGFTYFDTADAEPSPVMIQDVAWENIKRQFQIWTKEIAQNHNNL